MKNCKFDILSMWFMCTCEYDASLVTDIYIFILGNRSSYRYNEAVNVQVFKHLSPSMKNAFLEK